MPRFSYIDSDLETTGDAFDGVCLVFEQLLSGGSLPLRVFVGMGLLWSNWKGEGDGEMIEMQSRFSKHTLRLRENNLYIQVYYRILVKLSHKGHTPSCTTQPLLVFLRKEAAHTLRAVSRATPSHTVIVSLLVSS